MAESLDVSSKPSPYNEGELLRAARGAHIRKDWSEASRLWQHLIYHSPNHQGAWHSAGVALREQKRFSEAEEILSRSQDMFPQNLQIASARAWNALSLQDWEAAERLWRQFRENFPDDAGGFVGLSHALRRTGRIDELESLLELAAQRYPDSDAIAAEQAALVIHRRDWKTARPLLSNLVERFPNSARIQSDYGFVLLSSGDSDKAAEVLRAAMERFPNDSSIEMNLARTALARSEWREAARRWTALSERSPGNGYFKSQLGQARYNMSLLDSEVESVASEARSEQNEGASYPTREDGNQNVRLVTNFESLGEDCEFGLFQRNVGAEPLGLLRFAGTSPENLIAVLRCCFEGVGTTDHTKLDVSGDEYVARDERFGMTMHTHINPEKVGYEATYKMMIKKLCYLKGKLIDDLRDGEKIFVFKDKRGSMEPRLAQFREALDLYGKPRVFLVKLATEDENNGDVEIIDGNTMIGYIDRHGHDGTRWNIPVESWLTLCRRASKHWLVSG
jgi:tetratricopeptide (TPR) repeat protein